jgi:hypothetical protein
MPSGHHVHTGVWTEGRANVGSPSSADKIFIMLSSWGDDGDPVEPLCAAVRTCETTWVAKEDLVGSVSSVVEKDTTSVLIGVARERLCTLGDLNEPVGVEG